MHFDTDIPVPTRATRSNRWSTRFRAMKPGNSFPVAAEQSKQAASAARVYNHRHPDQHLVYETQADGSLRVWRAS